MRARLWIRFALFVMVIGLGAASVPVATAQDAPADDASQILSLTPNPRVVPTPALQDYLDAFLLGREAGTTGNVFTSQWSELEPSAGDYQLDDMANGIDFFDNVYDYLFLAGIQVLNTTDRETPPDLLDVPFDDPRMLQRFEALFDALLPHLTDNVRYLSIGNEVDVYLENMQEWDAYKTFYDGAVDYVHQAAPWIQVGVTATFGGAQQLTNEVMRLNEHSDVLILTYYPLGAAFTADNPAAPLTDFPAMVEMAAGRPVVLQEVGYPSAELLNGSEAEQAEFVQHVFEAWDAAGAAIPFLNYFLLHDLSEDLCTTLEGYYGLSHPNFHAYLCSIGLRQADGTPKLGWQAFMDAGQRWSGEQE